jgi:hypothetical protein
VSEPRDTALGLIACAIAGGYYYESTKIQQSLLSDGVGADGLPRVLAAGLAVTGLALIVRGLGRRAPADAAQASEIDDGLGIHLKAAGLFLMLVATVVVMPYAGYVATIAALIAAVATYAGARPGMPLVLSALGGAVAFWVAFRLLLGVPMPTGVLKWV